MGLTLPKRLFLQPTESRLYGIDFANLLGDATISSIAIQPAAEPTGLDTELTVGTGAISGTSVKFRLSTSTHGQTYSISTSIVDSDGNTITGNGVLVGYDITTVSGTTYSFSSAYCTLAQMELVFGEENIDEWADLNNLGDANEIEQRQAWAANLATNDIDDLLRGGHYSLPLPASDTTVSDMAARLAGIILYELRGKQDETESYEKMKTDVVRKLEKIRAGKIRLDLVKTTRGTNAPYVA